VVHQNECSYLKPGKERESERERKRGEGKEERGIQILCFYTSLLLPFKFVIVTDNIFRYSVPVNMDLSLVR
jgi:hypothetical protein